MRKILTIILLFSALITKAQQDFKQGYIVTLNNDTIYGNIDYQSDSQNSTICRFKTDSKELTEFSPTEIKAYRFLDSGKLFVSREIKTVRGSESYFLEYLIKGKLSVYYYRNNVSDHYLVEKDSLRLIELPPFEKKVIVNETEYIRDDHSTKSIFQFLTQDLPEMRDKIDHIYLEQKPLIKFASEYHKRACGDEGCMIYAKKPFPITFFIEPVLGIVKYNIGDIYINYKNQNGKIISESVNFGNQPQFGVLIHNWMPRTSEKLFFKTGILINPILLQLNNAKSEVRIYRVPLMFEYQYPKGKLRPTFATGWNVTFISDAYGVIDLLTPIEIGLNYRITDRLQIRANLNNEFNSIIALFDKYQDFTLISSTLSLGLIVKL